MSKRPLRGYQSEACDAIEDEWTRVRSTLLVAATGTGKSRMGAEIIRRRAPLGRVLWLAHRTELLDQAQDTIRDETGLVVGREQAASRSMVRNLWGVSDQVVVASIQTMHADRLRDRFRPDDFATVIIDEAHHAVASQYRAVLDYFRDSKVLGVTATPDRGDEVGLRAVFDTTAFQYDIQRGINDGYLCPIERYEVTVADLDISGVKVTMSADSGKDLNAGQIAKALEVDGVMHSIASPLVHRAGTRQTIVFTPTVDTAHHLASVLRGYTVAGVRAIDGTTADRERKDALAAFKAGDVQFLLNCAVLTEGFDAPSTSCVAIVRMTRSRALYAQMIGRGTRIHPGKANCLVLDFVPDQCGRHLLVTPADILAGKDLPDDVRKEANRLAQDGMPVLEALEAAELAKAERQEKERQRDEARKQKLRLQVEHQIKQIDPFGVVTPESMTGPKMRSATESILGSMRIELPPGTSDKAARDVIGEVTRRRRQNLCTWKQAKMFQQWGLSVNIPFAEASPIVDAILRNGPDKWRNPVPAEIVAKWGAR